MKKIIISLILLIMCSGCFNNVELNEYSIVTGIALDYIDDKYEISLLISNSSKNSSENNNESINAIVYSGKGDDIFDAIKDVGLISSKEIYIEHVSTLIISEEIAKKGLNNVFDFFLREPTAKNQFLVILAKDCKAKDILKILSPLNNFESDNISSNVKVDNKLQGEVVQISFNDLLNTILQEGSNPVLNGFIIKGDANKGSQLKELEQTNIKNYIKLDNLAIFKNDKLIKWANVDQSIGINLINNKIDETYDHINYKDGYVVLGTQQYNSKITIDLINNKPEVTIKANGTAVIHEVNSNSIDLYDAKTIQKLKKEFEKSLENKMKKAIKFAQKNKTDIFKIGNMFYKNEYKYYNSVKKIWNEEIFPNIKFKFDISIDIESKGTAENTIERITHEK